MSRPIRPNNSRPFTPQRITIGRNGEPAFYHPRTRFKHSLGTPHCDAPLSIRGAALRYGQDLVTNSKPQFALPTITWSHGTLMDESAGHEGHVDEVYHGFTSAHDNEPGTTRITAASTADSWYAVVTHDTRNDNVVLSTEDTNPLLVEQHPNFGQSTGFNIDYKPTLGFWDAFCGPQFDYSDEGDAGFAFIVDRGIHAQFRSIGNITSVLTALGLEGTELNQLLHSLLMYWTQHIDTTWNHLLQINEKKADDFTTEFDTSSNEGYGSEFTLSSDIKHISKADRETVDAAQIRIKVTPDGKLSLEIRHKFMNGFGEDELSPESLLIASAWQSTTFEDAWNQFKSIAGVR